MSRVACAILLTLLPAAAWAQTEDKPMYGDRPPGSATVAEALAQRIAEVHLADRPLHEAIEWVRGASGMNVVVRWSKLAEAGVDRDAPIILHLADVPLEKVLQIILQLASDRAELGFEDEQNVLTISTQADLDRVLVVHTYDVSGWVGPQREVRRPQVRLDVGLVPFDYGYYHGYHGYRYCEPLYGFAYPPDYDEPAEDPAHELIDVITNAVEPDSWMLNGGSGTISALDNVLVIRNSRRIHRMLAGSLGLRRIGESPRPKPRQATPPTN